MTTSTTAVQTNTESASGSNAATTQPTSTDAALQQQGATQAATDAAKQGAQSNAGEKGEPKDDKPQGAPAEYGAFKMPEGVTVDDATLNEFKPLAKAMNLNQEQAQQMVDFYTKALPSITQKIAEQTKAQVTANLVQENARNWLEQSRNDPVLGGAKFDENLDIAEKAVALGDDDFKKMLVSTGIANHPAMIRFMHAIGSRISEGKVVIPGATGAGQRSPEELLYGST